MKKLERLTSIIEAVVFLSGTPVAIKDLAEKLEASEGMILDAVETLQKKYDKETSGLQLLKFNKKLQFSSNPEFAEEVTSVLNPIKEKELSRSLLEVAAIIAYKQPVTRIDLEAIRGANSEYAIQKLLELKMIEPVGRKEAVGRPVLFGTTDEFLKRFEIDSLEALPDYDELLTKIRELNGESEAGSYLYKKPELNENGEQTAETAVTDSETTVKDEVKEEDLPDISEEEIPDFLKDENVSVVTGE